MTVNTPRVTIVIVGKGWTVMVADGAPCTVVVDGGADDVMVVTSVMVVLEIGVVVVVRVIVGTIVDVICGPTLSENCRM